METHTKRTLGTQPRTSDVGIKPIFLRGYDRALGPAPDLLLPHPLRKVRSLTVLVPFFFLVFLFILANNSLLKYPRGEPNPSSTMLLVLVDRPKLSRRRPHCTIATFLLVLAEKIARSVIIHGLFLPACKVWYKHMERVGDIELCEIRDGGQRFEGGRKAGSREIQ